MSEDAQTPAKPERPEEPALTYAGVALNIPFGQVFTYRVPEELREEIAPGKRVRVPFGRRRMTGYCVGLSAETDTPAGKIRDVLAVIDPEPLLSDSLLKLTRWIAETYVCSWGQVLEEALPAGVRSGTRARKELHVRPLLSPDDLRRRADELPPRSRKRAQVLRLLAEAGREMSLAEIRAEIPNATRQTVTVAGCTEVIERRFRPDALAGYEVTRTKPLTPTPEQRRALDAIGARLEPPQFGVFLLHGVTGSGKTEVYLQALRRVVDSGRQGIVLVPEISLTPQTIRRFLERFDDVAVLHSRITTAERREQWRRIHTEEPEVVIGTRSAIFAPVRRLGLVVIDEEHEPSFKQPATPRYHARETAVERARSENAVVILGSATPALESYYHARSGRYALLQLGRRVEERPMPRVELVDMREAFAEQKRFVLFSRHMIEAMRRTLALGEQVILFLNRRGFSTYIHCRRCGHVLKCASCDIALTYHRVAREARCHHCNRAFEAPEICPECGVGRLNYFGSGTQRVEDVVRRLFPDQTVARMDTDTTSGRGSHRTVLDAFGVGEIDILLGTQMIGKGLDFPNVTLVGVISADVALNLPDFRSSERTFQLLAQVAGRTGRSYKGGRVLVQTMSPELSCIAHAARHDYAGFAEEELAHRAALGYPPFRRLARIVISSQEKDAIPDRAHAISRFLDRFAGPDTEIAGPMEAPLAKIRGWHRWHFVVKTPPPEEEGGEDEMLRLFRLCAAAFKPGGKCRVIVDVDPVTML